MAAYRYPYRRRRFSPYALRRRPVDGRAVAAGAAVVLAVYVMHARPNAAHAGTRQAPAHGGIRHVQRPASSLREARLAVAYAESKTGRVPYVWGGTTDAGMDCSALTMNAWAHAGVRIARTSQDQWATLKHVTSPRPGDLVFFAGADGTPTSPGHVGIVVNPAKHLMVDAYATGTLIRYDTYGPRESAPGLIPVGFTDPAGGT